MKKSMFLAVAITAALSFASCGSSQKNAAANYPQGGSPFGDVYTVPAAEYDTDEYFGTTGIATGPKARMDVLQMSALTNAQNIIRQKMQHAYKGVIDDYSNYVGNNAGADAVTKIERGGTQMIDAIVNETQASKGPMFSAVDEKGNVTCFIGIRISKKAVAEKITDYVSEDEELKIRFLEEQFRKRMDESFKKFRENK